MVRRIRRTLADLFASLKLLGVLGALTAFLLASGDGGGGVGEGGEGGGESKDEGSGAGSGEQAKDDANDQAGSSHAEVKMTQAELDKLIDGRLAKARKSWDDEAKQKAERAKMDEAERLKAEKADAEKAAADKVTGANKRIITAEAKLAALAAGVPKERLTRFLRNVDLDDIDVSDDGDVDEKAVAKAVKDALDDVPEFKGSANGHSGNGQSGGEHNGGGQQKKFTRDEIAKMSVEEFEKNEQAIMAQMRSEASVK
jgi:hypothetical protein